jgi:hypothetical protein
MPQSPRDPPPSQVNGSGKTANARFCAGQGVKFARDEGQSLTLS